MLNGEECRCRDDPEGVEETDFVKMRKSGDDTKQEADKEEGDQEDDKDDDDL